MHDAYRMVTAWVRGVAASTTQGCMQGSLSVRRTSTERSEPEKPSSRVARPSTSCALSSCGVAPRCMRSRVARASASGSGTWMRRSKRRLTAGSSAHGTLVAASTSTPCAASDMRTSSSFLRRRVESFSPSVRAETSASTCACGAHGVCMRCACGTHAVCMQCACGAHAVHTMRCACGVHAVRICSVEPNERIDLYMHGMHMQMLAHRPRR